MPETEDGLHLRRNRHYPVADAKFLRLKRHYVKFGSGFGAGSVTSISKRLY
jgi:hypothetical protein